MNRPLLRQTWTVSAVLINTVGQGMMNSFPTSLVPALRDPNSSIKADLNTAAWLGSSALTAYAVGAFMFSILTDIFGRKKTHLICIFPGLIGWILIYCATDITTIMCGRILTGINSGGTLSAACIVIGEYTSPKYRGVFLNLKTAGNCVGSMILHILSFYLSWRNIALVSMVPHVISLLITLTWPESPAWLASRKQFERSEQAFYWLRGRDEASRKEIEEMITIHMNQAKRERKLHIIYETRELFKKFTDKALLKPVFINIVGMVLLEVCGRHYFPSYAVQIVGEITANKSESFYYTIVIDIIIISSVVSSSVFVRLIKRRTLLFCTGFAAVAVLATACVYLYIVSLGLLSKERSWIPVTIFVVYFILANLGCTPIPLVLLGELYPLAHRGLGMTTSGISISLAAFFTLQMTPHMLLAFNVYGMFAVFGSVIALCLGIMYCTLPETKDKTLQEIENYFKYGQYDRHYNNVVEDEVKTKMMPSVVINKI